jgi:DNA-binding MarR family transcriptional regulator
MPESHDTNRPLPALIALAFARVTEDMLLSLHAAGFDDLRMAHLLTVVRHMTGDGDRPATLARRAGVSPQAISLALSELETMGYIRREPDELDRRSQRVFWSERGQRAGAALEAHFRRTESRWAQDLGSDAIDSARRVLALAASAEPAESL